MASKTEVRANPLLTRADWEAQRRAVADNPGRFHGGIAKREIHWYDSQMNAWITWSDEAGRWTGFDAGTGLPRIDVAYGPDHEPWARAFNGDDPPFYRWFEGGLTNACFNEVDRHVLAGFGDEVAYYFEGDRWDPALHDGRGGPVVHAAITRKQFLIETVKAALVLESLGLKAGDRIAMNMPNVMPQIYYTEAAKRLGVIYTPVFGGFSDKTLSDRIQDAGARVVLTADGSYRNAQLVPFKEAYSDPALDNFIAVETALGIVSKALDRLGLAKETAEAMRRGAREALSGEITVERADVLRGIGRTLEELAGLDPARKSRVRTEVALALMDAPSRVETVIVIRHTGQELTWRPERDRWAHELEAEALRKILEAAGRLGLRVKAEEDLLALNTPGLIRLLYTLSPPKPLDAEYPMFIIYTSGSTGKPKGVVHVHGGYVAGVAHTMKVSFDARPGEDVIYVVADPGWITGQSYLISAALTTRTTGIVTEGTPVFPHAGRFASIIDRHKATIFKAGVTFLKSIMSNPQNRLDAERYDMKSLRVATFCAEPVSPAVQQFGMELMCPRYINSYWATEHGGIVWTHFYGNDDFPLRPDAHTYPLPWVFGDVWVAEGTDGEGRWRYRIAGPGEKGEIVIARPYPYLARTIWGDAERFGQPGWKGDAPRYAQTYWGKWSGAWAYTQGDFAIKHDDGSFSLHGRSDDVINVSGHRLGTEEIEGAILRDRQLNPDSPVGNVIVVGAPHREKGLTPVAFVMTAPGRRLTLEDRRRLTELVRQEKGAVAIPSDFIEVSQFPETRSGKYMRRFLSNTIQGEPLGDTTTLKNPESLAEIRAKIEAWRDRARIEESQRIFEIYRYFRIQYHDVRPGEKLAVVTVSNPPVNALNERALDELGTIVDHLSRREEVRVVVFTGDGTASFVAGADIKQLLEEMHTVEDALPLPKKAHLAFRKIERMPKPVIAAVNGVALGGGNEFQMACHYRIAEPTARFGQPEIALRLLPGYGGTQRLPRLLAARDKKRGLLTALEIMLHGRQLEAEEALAIGLIDEIAYEQDVVSRATTLAREHVLTGRGALDRAFREREAMMAEWETPQRFPEKAINNDPEIRRLSRQTEMAGRAGAVKLILEVVRHGWERGFSSGIEREAQRFAEAVIDPEGGKAGILAFIEKRSAPLPARRRREPSPAEREALIKDGALLPPGAPFFPGITPLPAWQHAWAAVKSGETGETLHGDPARVETEIVVPVDRPGPHEALCYVLASEVNFNDVWAITGIPVSPFDDHDQDYHVTGSGGVGLVAAVGSEVKKEGRVKVGDLAVIYSGQSDLLAPIAGLDPMATSGFIIQGYQGPDGSHQQFMIGQAPQVLPKPPDLTLEAAGSYVLKLGTVYRALFTTLKIQPGKSLFVEGAATGTGYDALKTAALNGLDAFGLVSSAERARVVLDAGAKGAINRADPRYRGIFTIVPADPSRWKAWEEAGRPLIEDFRAKNGGRLADYAVSHAGEQAFPRSFQLLEPGGTLTFYGASSGYYFSFLGKAGDKFPEEMLTAAGLRAGEAALIFYGTDTDADGIVDRAGLEAIEAARERAARIVAVTYTDAQKEFVLSLGYGDAVKGVVSLAEIKRKHGENFAWPSAFPELPDAKASTAAFKEVIRLFNDKTLKPLGSAIGGYLRTPDNPRGYPDLIFERAGHDALGVSTALVKPFTGRVVYSEDTAGRRYTFFAPQVWMRQRRIYMPSANIWGTHLSNAYEVLRMNEMVDTGLLEVAEPVEVEWSGLREAHQAIWENRHAGSAYVLNHALPRRGLKSKDELYEAWAAGG